MDTFGKRFDYYIKQSDYKSYASFARDVGVSVVTISNIKDKNSPTTTDKISKMVELLRQHGVDVNYNWLLHGIGESTMDHELKQAKRNESFYRKKYFDAKSGLDALVKDCSNQENPRATSKYVNHQYRLRI